MAKRESLDDEDGGGYFKKQSSVKTFPTGSTGLDLALGGGYAVGRTINIVGDRSTGKTQLAIESMANFNIKFDDGPIRYEDSEHAFDEEFAGSVGLPEDRVDIPDDPVATVEEWFDAVSDFEKTVPKKSQGLYILDSMDALTTSDELEAGMDAKTYGMAKAKKLSQFFRTINPVIAKKDITLMVISQLRDKVGFTMGETQTRVGGRALDFFSSQIIWLNNMGQIKRKIKDVERAVGVRTRARIKKNKIGPPFREFEFPIMFYYGIDDLVSLVEWLAEVKHLAPLDVGEKEITKYVKAIKRLTGKDYRKAVEKVREVAWDKWHSIEQDFHPGRRKYDQDEE